MSDRITLGDLIRDLTDLQDQFGGDLPIFISKGAETLIISKNIDGDYLWLEYPETEMGGLDSFNPCEPLYGLISVQDDPKH